MSIIISSNSWSISFQGSKETVVITGGDVLDFVALGGMFLSCFAGYVSS